MHRKVAAALVAALALALASCGGSEKTETVSRAQLISRLEATCLAGQREGKKQAQGSSGQEAFLKAVLADQKYVLDRVGNVEATGSAKADFDTYKDAVQRQVDLLERLASADRADLPRAVRAMQPQLEAVSTRARSSLVRLDAERVCG
jgi:hypothetical protein